MVFAYAGSSTTVFAASWMYLTIEAGVPLGAMIRYHTPFDTSQPDSFDVGVSGNTGWRFSWKTASTRMRLPSTRGLTSPGCATTASMWLPRSAGEDCAQPA